MAGRRAWPRSVHAALPAGARLRMAACRIRVDVLLVNDWPDDPQGSPSCPGGQAHSAAAPGRSAASAFHNQARKRLLIDAQLLGHVRDRAARRTYQRHRVSPISAESTSPTRAPVPEPLVIQVSRCPRSRGRPVGSVAPGPVTWPVISRCPPRLPGRPDRPRMLTIDRVETAARLPTAAGATPNAHLLRPSPSPCGAATRTPGGQGLVHGVRI